MKVNCESINVGAAVVRSKNRTWKLLSPTTSTYGTMFPSFPSKLVTTGIAKPSPRSGTRATL